ncbi:MAG: hypothetical protein ACPIOQ_49425, partial [Promethearchaeia archaeon]
MVRTKPSDYIAYPLRIKYPSFGFDLSQTSSTPCDSNTITVSVAPSVPMLVGCAPCVSISGLNGMVRPHDVSTGLPLNSSSINETQVRNSTNVLVGAAPLTYGEKHGKLCETGDSSVGFCLSGLSALHAPRAFVPALSDTEETMRSKLAFDAAFEVTNKASQHPSATVQMCVKHGQIDSSDNCLQISNPLSVMQPTWDVKTLMLGGSPASSTVYPCEEQSITVQLQPNVPLFRHCASTEPVRLVISGLTIFQDLPSAAMEYQLNSNTARNGTLSSDGTNLSIPVADLIASNNASLDHLPSGAVYNITFTRWIAVDTGNTAANIRAEVVTTSQSVMCASHAVGSLAVECLRWTLLSLEQTSSAPCDQNTVTVSLRSSVSLLSTCGTNTTNRALPKLTITGLDAISTPSTTSLAITGNSGVSGEGVASSARWNTSTLSNEQWGNSKLVLDLQSGGIVRG